jgi:hypothetical protein
LTNLTHHLFTIRLVDLEDKVSPIDDFKIHFEKENLVFLSFSFTTFRKKSEKITRFLYQNHVSSQQYRTMLRAFFTFKFWLNLFTDVASLAHYNRKLLKKPLIPMFIVWSDFNQVHANRLTA